MNEGEYNVYVTTINETRNLPQGTYRLKNRSVKMSFDNFESIVVSWLHAIGEFNDSDEPHLIDFDYDEFTDSLTFQFDMNKQLELPFGDDPLGR